VVSAYQALPRGRCTRLVGLEPGQRSDPLRVHFCIVDLDAANVTSYEALSYAWGKCDSLPAAVFLGDQDINVTFSLQQALTALRLATTTRYLWIDAISINQNDLIEREYQVSLMSMIYRNASRVIVWLGKASTTDDSKSLEDTEDEFGMVCTIVNGNQEVAGWRPQAYYSLIDDTGAARKRLNTTTGETSCSDADVSGELSPFFRKLIVNLFNRDWFWRLWVFQEIILATYAIARIGQAEIDWRWIGRAAAILRTNHHHLCQELSVGGVSNAYLMFRYSRQSDLPAVQTAFLRLLRLTRQFEVTDPRDRIYGLLGITTSDSQPETGELFMKPDYSINPDQLWRLVAMKSLRLTNDLSLLSCVQHYQSSTNSSAVPKEADVSKIAETKPGLLASWIPDWRQAARTTLSAWDEEEAFNAAKGYPRSMRYQCTSDVLVLKGMAVGSVALVIEPDLRPDQNLTNLKHLFARPDSSTHFFADQKARHLLISTQLAGSDSYGGLADTDEGILFYKCAEFAKLYENPRSLPRVDLSGFASGLAVRTIKRMAQVCERRLLFMTTNGFLGLGSDTICASYEVAVLGGGETPFILRSGRHQGSSDQARSGYTLVGECYVEGLMKGEAVDHLRLGKSLKGPVPLEVTLQALLNKWRERGHGIEEARAELANVKAQKLVESWFEIR
jgi:hypothetical protein